MTPYFLTVPHSGTRYFQHVLWKTGLKVHRAQRSGVYKQVSWGHLHEWDAWNNAENILVVLRDPLMVVLSNLIDYDQAATFGRAQTMLAKNLWGLRQLKEHRVVNVENIDWEGVVRPWLGPLAPESFEEFLPDTPKYSREYEAKERAKAKDIEWLEQNCRSAIDWLRLHWPDVQHRWTGYDTGWWETPVTIPLPQPDPERRLA